jgi:non-specific serine/threonine protein kinase
MAWSQESGEYAEFGLRIAAVLAWFWRLRGHLTEGRSWLEVTLAACPDRTALRSKALARTTLLTYGQGDNRRAKALAEESVSIAREVEDDSTIGWALHAMGRALHSNAEYEPAAVVLEESLQRFRATGNIVGLSYSSWYLGDVMSAQEDYERAASLMEDGLRFAHQSGDTWALASAYLNAGTLAYRQQDFNRSSTLLKKSLVQFRNIRARWGMWFPVSNLGTVASGQGYVKRAVCLAGADKTLGEAIGVIMTPSHRADYEEGLASARLALSDSEFDAAWSEGTSMTSERAIDYALSSDDESLT